MPLVVLTFEILLATAWGGSQTRGGPSPARSPTARAGAVWGYLIYVLPLALFLLFWLFIPPI